MGFFWVISSQRTRCCVTSREYDSTGAKKKKRGSEKRPVQHKKIRTANTTKKKKN